MNSTLSQGFLPFEHEPYSNFKNEAVAEQQRAAFALVRRKYGGHVFPLLIDGQTAKGDSTFWVRNPATGEALWQFQNANHQQRDAAVTSAQAAFETWQDTEALQRASIFKKAAALLRARRFEFNAVMILENGKNWAEADGEIAESVDHFEVFARETLRWAEGKSVYALPDEHVTMQYEALGVVVTISPWNFPSAIPLGMSLGALAAGNSVIWKPASETPLSSWLLIELLLEAGLPRTCIQFLTGGDEVLGDPLVDHKDVRMIAFTGSREIGCRIYQRAAVVQPKQRWLKRVMAEMGGKDATVVCADADLDAAALGIAQSAFGYSGQKCSACSRAIIESSVYDQVLERVLTHARALQAGLPEDNADYGPVIHLDSAERLRRYIKAGQTSAQLLLGGEWPQDSQQAVYVPPTIFGEVQSSDPLFQEELFGPVLSFSRADDWQHALRLANDSEYGLTGSFYSLDPHKISEARRRFQVGNLYINRKCTGALSGTHAFGGYGMSGTNAKVGGPDYLFWFLQTKTLAQRY